MSCFQILTCVGIERKMKTHLLSAILLSTMATMHSHAFGQSCCAPTATDFPKAGGNYGNDNYSSLAQINRTNIASLGAAWHNNLEGGSKDLYQQATAVAAGGVLYIETSQGNVFAVDGKTGKTMWKYESGAGTQLHRGVAVGANRVYATMAQNQVVALDQATGALVWKKHLEETTIGSLKTAVVYYDGMIYLGSSDGPRGAAFALNADTGDVVWKFFGAPGPGEVGNDTWGGAAWMSGGASPWMHPAIDPELGLVYWAFGNARGANAPAGAAPNGDEGAFGNPRGGPGGGNGAPYPGGAVNGANRAGQNLFADSLVAFDAKTGKVAWYFQSVHHDIWDFDNVMAPVLFDGKVDGKMSKGIIYGSKTGLYYVLDRTSGKPLTPIEEKPVPQAPSQKTWPTQPIPRGDSMIPLCPAATGPTAPPPNYISGCLFTPHTDQPVISAPGTGGAGDWSALSYDPHTHLLYSGLGFINSAHDTVDGGVGFRPLGEMRSGRINAFNPATHKVVWHRDMKWSLAHGNGILTTQGNVMFIGQPDGLLLGLDIGNGRELWKFQTGAGVHSSPIAYQVDGEEYIAVFAGGNALPYNSPRGDDLWAFKLGGKVPEAQAPEPPPVRQPILGAAVEGAAVHNTINLARTYRNGAVGETESTAQGAMAPQILRVPKGTTVTFLNPAGNKSDHCATQFYEGLFNSGPIQPGKSFDYTFKETGEYFYNDCASPRTTGKVIVY